MLAYVCHCSDVSSVVLHCFQMMRIVILFIALVRTRFDVETDEPSILIKGTRGI